MKPTRLSIAMVSILLGFATLAPAQSPSTKLTPLSKLSTLDVTSMLQPSLSPGEAAPTPIQVAAQFLQLQPAQQTAFGTLLQTRQTAVTPLFVGIAQRQKQIDALLSSGGDPTHIGALLLQIHALQAQVAQVQQSFLTSFNSLLDQDQQQRLAGVGVAIQLQPVVPAFELLQLF